MDRHGGGERFEDDVRAEGRGFRAGGLCNGFGLADHRRYSRHEVLPEHQKTGGAALAADYAGRLEQAGTTVITANGTKDSVTFKLYGQINRGWRWAIRSKLPHLYGFGHQARLKRFFRISLFLLRAA